MQKHNGEGGNLMASYSVNTLATLLEGEAIGDDTLIVSDFSSPEDARKGSLLLLHDAKNVEAIAAHPASVIVTHENFKTGKTLILVKDTRKAFITLLDLFYPAPEVTRAIAESARIRASVTLGKNVSIGEGAVIAENATIGDNAIIGANATIGEGVVIGRDTRVYENVSVYYNVVIGERCIIHSGAVIGADGFGYTELPDGSRIKIPQRGNVVIGNDVEIGANTTIDRATMGSTRVGNGVKIDNLVQIAHNCVIGDHSVIVSQVGIAGSSKIGAHVVIAGQAGIADHVTIGDGSLILAQAGIMSGETHEANSKLWGSPAQNMRAESVKQISLKKLPELISLVEKKFDVRIKSK